MLSIFYAKIQNSDVTAQSDLSICWLHMHVSMMCFSVYGLYTGMKPYSSATSHTAGPWNTKTFSLLAYSHTLVQAQNKYVGAMMNATKFFLGLSI